MSNYSVFYAPHADDELLTMGVGVRNSIDEGREVIVVLLTDGSADLTYNVLNSIQKCNWHGKYHNASEDKYLDESIDKLIFGFRRTVEFRDSCLALGVKPENIHTFSFKDGELTKEFAETVIQHFTKLFPEAVHSTLTYLTDIEFHNDHLALGQALLGLYNDEKVGEARFYVKRNHWGIMDNWNDKHHYVVENANVEQKKHIQNAINVYKCWNPSKAHYAIGYHSVPKSFDHLQENMISRYHLPNIKNM